MRQPTIGGFFYLYGGFNRIAMPSILLNWLNWRSKMSINIIGGHIYTSSEIFNSGVYLVERLELYRFTVNPDGPGFSRGYRIANLYSGDIKIISAENADQLIFSLSYISSRDFPSNSADKFLEAAIKTGDFSLVAVKEALFSSEEANNHDRFGIH